MFFSKYFSISRRLMIFFGLAAVFTVFASSLAIATFWDSKKSLDTITSEHVTQLTTAHQIALSSQAITAKARTLLSTTSQTSRKVVIDQIDDEINLMDEFIDRLTVEQGDNLDELKKTRKNLLATYHTLGDLAYQKIDIINKQKDISKKLYRSIKAYKSHFHDHKARNTIYSFSSAAYKAEFYGAAVSRSLLTALNTDTKGQLKYIRTGFEDAFNGLYRSVNDLPDSFNKKEINKIVSEWNSFISGTESIFDLHRQQFRIEKELRNHAQIYDRHARWLVSVTYSIINNIEMEMQLAMDDFHDELKKNEILLVIISIVCMLLAITLAFRIGRNIGTRIEILQRSMVSHAKGIRGEIPDGGNDEIGQMALSLKMFIAKIEERENDLCAARDELGYKVSELESAQKALSISEQSFKDFASVSAGWFWEMDAKLRFTMAEGHVLDSAGITSNEILGKTLKELTGNEDSLNDLPQLELTQAFDNYEFSWPVENGEDLYFRISGKPLFDQDGIFCGYRGTGSDVTEAYQLSKKLFYQANHDSLTGLVNRNAFEKASLSILDRLKVSDHGYALCYLDLDRFKIVNDTCGHSAGDELLKQISNILKDNVRSCDTVARLGGDEFGILLENCSIANAEQTAKKLCKAIHEFRFIWQDKTFTVGASIGLVPIPSSTTDIIDLMKAADTACYTAKDQGRNRVHVHYEEDSELNKKKGDMEWVAKINQALDEDRFVLLAQPIISLNTPDSGHHYEILIRMLGDNNELIPPGAFLSLAERYGLAPQIDLWVIKNTFAWLRDNPEHVDDLYLCNINLSAHTLSHENFFDDVNTLLKKHQVPANKICFEITETAAISNPTQAKQLIESLKSQGFKFALDDFGSGFSWFGSMKKLPVDFLKIDGSFVADIDKDPVRRAMVSSINDIGQLMGKKTIAEFVENKEIMAILRDIGVDFAQGYTIAKGMGIDELITDCTALD